MTIVMMRSGGLGLLGCVGRITANAFEAKIDNTTVAITKQLFVFMQKIYGRVQSIAMRHPEDFPLLPKDGLGFPHSREEPQRSTA